VAIWLASPHSAAKSTPNEVSATGQAGVADRAAVISSNSACSGSVSDSRMSRIAPIANNTATAASTPRSGRRYSKRPAIAAIAHCSAKAAQPR
jgi:hypothetical protein